MVAKSPLTGGYGKSEAGGWFGPELKFAGFDAIVIEGRARRCIYLGNNNYFRKTDSEVHPIYEEVWL